MSACTRGCLAAPWAAVSWARGKERGVHDELQTLCAAQSQCEGEWSCSDVSQLLSVAVTASHTQDSSRQRLSSGFKKEARRKGRRDLEERSWLQHPGLPKPHVGPGGTALCQLAGWLLVYKILITVERAALVPMHPAWRPGEGLPEQRQGTGGGERREDAHSVEGTRSILQPSLAGLVEQQGRGGQPSWGALPSAAARLPSPLALPVIPVACGR